MDTGMMSTISMIGSAASMAATAYIWITRFRRERPNLRIYPSDQTAEVTLGPYRGDLRSVQFRTVAVVANYSSLPNAVLAAELAMKRRDGDWNEIACPCAAGLPLNVPPMMTVRLELTWSTNWRALDSAEKLPNHEIVAAYLNHYCGEKPRIGLSVWALGDTEFRAVLPFALPPIDAERIPLRKAA
jgi:hypothetical protein